MKIPTRQQILRDFIKWTQKGSDSTFQFQRAVRRWINCGYAVAEIPFVFEVTPAQLQTAIKAAKS